MPAFRAVLLLICSGVLLVLSSCQRATAPTSLATPASTPTTPITVSFGPGESIPAIFELTVDPVAMRATSRPLTARTASGFQASQYDLDITKFQKPAQFNVQSVQFTPIGDVEITFRHAHPWGPVDLTKPPSATNRADLGYTGRLLILADLAPADIPSNTFFGDVRANTELVYLPDGFVQPRDLLAKSGFNANCFPYVLLADEAKDNRIGISNNGLDAGNWDPAVGGWQRSNLGSNGNGWTGYDFVHAGQTIENSFVLNADELTGGPLTLQVALLIKYTEPKGVGGETGRQLRLPPAMVDVTQFAYRAPHAALDVSRVNSYAQVMQVVEAGGGPHNGRSYANRIRDWDAIATEAATPDIAGASDVALIEPGTGGFPTADLSAPAGVLANGMAFHDPDQGDGQARSETVFDIRDVLSSPGALAIQDVPALVRYTDAGEGVVTGSPHYGVDPQTILPDALRSLPSVTYQAMTIRIVPTPPTWTEYLVDTASYCGTYTSMCLLENDPANPFDDRLGIAYTDDVNRTLKFARSLTAFPTSSADWQTMVVDPSPGSGYGCEIVWDAGRPLIAYYNQDARELRAARATVPAPASPADWEPYAIQGGLQGDETELGLAVSPLGHAVVAYSNNAARALRVARATVAQPHALDWQTYLLYGPLTLHPFKPRSLSVAAVGTGFQLLASGILPVTTPFGTRTQGLLFYTASSQPTLGAWGGYLVPSQQGEVRTDGVGSAMVIKDALRGAGVWLNAGGLPIDDKPWIVNATGANQSALELASKDIARIDGRLTASFANGRTWARQLVPTPRRPEDWQCLVLFESTNGIPEDLTLLNYRETHVLAVHKFDSGLANGFLSIRYNNEPW